VGEREDHNNSGGVRERVTIREAATLLGVHPNTIRNRVKAGIYSAEKAVTERGETWMIDRDSWTTNTPSSDPQQLVSRAPALPAEALQVLAREVVREAGLAKDPDREAEREARLEANKLRMEAAKTQVLISSGLLLGMVAVAGILPTRTETKYLWIAVLSIVASAGLAVGNMEMLARAVEAQAPLMRVYPVVTFLFFVLRAS
jgi:hypothetical protein